MYEEWLRCITDYLLWLSIGASNGTVRLRRSYLTRLARAVDTGPWSTSSKQLAEFITGFGPSPETRRSVRTSIVHFYAWAVDDGRIEISPARKLPTVRIPRKQPRPTPDMVYAPAMEHADRRERLMIILGAQGGLRRAEIARVRGVDLDERHILCIIGKGGRERRVPIVNLELITALRAADTDYLFPGDTVEGHVGADWVGKLLKRELAAPGWTGHTLRHRFGTRAFRASKDIRAVQELLGHASVATTMVYTLVDDESLLAAVRGAA